MSGVMAASPTAKEQIWVQPAMNAAYFCPLHETMKDK